MTISAFANEHRPDGWHRSGTVRQAYRERKRRQAEHRQAAFDDEVGRVAREQHCGPADARYVVNARRRHEHRTATR